MVKPPPVRPRRDRILMGLLVLVVLVLVTIAAVYSFQADSGVDAIERSDRIAGCRASYRAEADAAIYALEAADADLDLVFGRALVAASSEDPAVEATLPDLLALIEEAQAAIPPLQQQLRQATDDYGSAVRLSSDDTATFLQRCATEHR